ERSAPQLRRKPPVQVSPVDPAPPSRLQPKVPHDLTTICLKCLEKAPARRYQSAAELAEDLQRWLEGRPIAARRVGVLGRTRRWCRRNPGLAGAIGAAALFLVLGSIVSSLLAVRSLAGAGPAPPGAPRARAAQQFSH